MSLQPEIRGLAGGFEGVRKGQTSEGTANLIGRSVSMLPKKMFQIPVLRNAISCVFRGAFLVNKDQGKCNS